MSSFSLASLLASVFFPKQVLANVLDRVCGLVLCQFLECFNETWHDMFVEVLANGEIWVHGVLVQLLLSIFWFSILNVYFNNK